MQVPDLEFIANLQRFALLFSFLVGIAIIVAAIALCFIANHTASIRDELLKIRVDAEITSQRRREVKSS